MVAEAPVSVVSICLPAIFYLIRRVFGQGFWSLFSARLKVSNISAPLKERRVGGDTRIASEKRPIRDLADLEAGKSSL